MPRHTKKKSKRLPRRMKKCRRTRRRKGGDNPPPAAIIEYLEYYPMKTKKTVDEFYQKVNKKWGYDVDPDTNMVFINNKETKRVNNIEEVLEAVSQAKRTTFCKRKDGDGDCEETADEVIGIITNKPGGKYTVSSQQLMYYIEDIDEWTGESGDPEMVQNHGFLVFYDDKSKPWFRPIGREELN